MGYILMLMVKDKLFEHLQCEGMDRCVRELLLRFQRNKKKQFAFAFEI